MSKDIFVVSFNHHQLSVDQRALVSLGPNDIQKLYSLLRGKVLSCMVLNTCNRTEYYGVGDLNQLVEALHHIYEGESVRCLGDFMEVRTQDKAVVHMFNVASGLDSKVLGDLEILGQFKSACKLAKQSGCTDGFFEKWANNALEVAKKVRTETQITSGTVSLAYAAIKGVKHYFSNRKPNILIIGAGKFGKSIGVNARSYLPQASLTICNRTQLKAQNLAHQIKARVLPMASLIEAINQYDVVISAIEFGGQYLVTEDMLSSERDQLFIDMSVPPTVDPAINKRSGKQYISIDDVSHEVDNTLDSRMAELPKAKALVKKQLSIFSKFMRIHENSHSIKEWKEMLHKVSTSCPHLRQKEPQDVNLAIKKSTGAFAKFIRQSSTEVANSNQLIQQFMNEQEESWFCEKTKSACFNAGNADCKSRS